MSNNQIMLMHTMVLKSLIFLKYLQSMLLNYVKLVLSKQQYLASIRLLDPWEQNFLLLKLKKEIFLFK